MGYGPPKEQAVYVGVYVCVHIYVCVCIVVWLCVDLYCDLLKGSPYEWDTVPPREQAMYVCVYTNLFSGSAVT